jgi:hypothetical protein
MYARPDKRGAPQGEYVSTYDSRDDLASAIRAGTFSESLSLAQPPDSPASDSKLKSLAQLSARNRELQLPHIAPPHLTPHPPNPPHPPVPMWSAPSMTRMFRGQRAYDGGFRRALPCPPGVTFCVTASVLPPLDPYEILRNLLESDTLKAISWALRSTLGTAPWQFISNVSLFFFGGGVVFFREGREGCRVVVAAGKKAMLVRQLVSVSLTQPLPRSTRRLASSCARTATLTGRWTRW